eukprot:163725-Amphidinium_carterae.1
MSTAGMVLNAKKTKVVVNGRVARQSVKRSWVGRSLPSLELTVRDLGVDMQWAARRNPVQRTRIGTFTFSMKRLQLLGLPKSAKARIMSALWSQGMYGAGGRAALGKGARKRRAAEIELSLAGQAAKILRSSSRGGRHFTPHLGSLGAARWQLATLLHSVGTRQLQERWAFKCFSRASATGAQDSHAWTLKQVAGRRPDFAGLEAGLDPVDLQHWRKLSNKATHAGRAACSAAAGGLWHAARLASVFDHDGSCVWCQDQAGTLHH